MSYNIFLFIIWNNAYPEKERILDDLKYSFHIIKTIEIQWKKENFNRNLVRFYGQKLPPNSFKEKACGLGPFTLVVYEDPAPRYEDRMTTRGVPERVNINSFDKKVKKEVKQKKYEHKDCKKIINLVHGNEEGH